MRLYVRPFFFYYTTQYKRPWGPFGAGSTEFGRTTAGSGMCQVLPSEPQRRVLLPRATISPASLCAHSHGSQNLQLLFSSPVSLDPAGLQA